MLLLLLLLLKIRTAIDDIEAGFVIGSGQQIIIIIIIIHSETFLFKFRRRSVEGDSHLQRFVIGYLRHLHVNYARVNDFLLNVSYTF